MAINPDDITTVRVDQLTPEVITLTSILPHQLGTDLKQGTVQDLVNLVATAIGAGSGVGFLPISVINGQQLPDIPADPSFFLCGPGTYLNINGYVDVICTGELNAVMSLLDHWGVAVEIPIIAEIGVQTVTGSAVDNTDPLNPIIDLRTDVLHGYYVNSTQFDDLNFTPFIPNSAKIYVNNAAPFGIYIWNGSAYIIVAETNAGGGGGTQTLQQTMALGRTYVQTIGTLTYTFTLIDDTVELSVFDSSTNITNKLLLQDGAELSYLDPDNGKSSSVLTHEGGVLSVATNPYGSNALIIPYKTSGSGSAQFRVQNNLLEGTYELATLNDLANTNTNAIDRITVKLSQSINKGQAVYISSANGTNIIVSKASNSSEATSSKTLGLLETTGVTNDIVNVVTSGLLSGLNTSTATIGDAVWLGVNGDLLYGLANKPYAPAHLVYIGVVSRVSATVGEIIVKVQNGFELKEIHDVDLISNAPTNNQGLIYESATSLWKNKTIDKTLVGLGNVDNTSDANKPVSSAQLTAINAKVSDTITDGITTIAPSQNAVFDALNTLRLPIDSVGNTTLTGTITETKVATLLAAANTFDSACFVYLTYNFMKSVANAIAIKLYVNTSDSLTGATLLGQYLTGSNRNVDFTRKFILRGTTLDLLTDTTSRITNINNDTVFASSTTVTVAPTSALYFIFSVTLDLVGSVVTNKVAILEKQKL